MSDIKLDLKVVLTILSAACVLGGFYYTTQHRLDNLEQKIEDIESDISKVKKSVNRKNKQ